MQPSNLLAFGFRGTLRATGEVAGPVCDGSTPQELASLEPPPQVAETVHRQVQAAAAILLRRAPSAALRLCGEAIAFAGLEDILGDRLLGLLTQAVDGTNSSSGDEQLRALPELLRLVAETSADWVQASLTFLRRLEKDQHRLAACLPDGRLPAIVRITGCASDLHGGGHAVLRVEFAGGAVVFYKPRPVTGEWLWHDLLDIIGRQHPALELPSAKVLRARDPFGYGWVWSLLPQEQGQGNAAARTQAESPVYWNRAGAVLCLAQHLRLTDLHLGNVLALPDGPALVDLECLGTPARAGRQYRSYQAEAVPDAIASLLGTGLLPWGDRQTATLDVSGLFGRPRPVDRVLLPCWKPSESGSYRLLGSRAVLVDHGNRPDVHGNRSDVAATLTQVLPQLVLGYRQAAEALLSVRAQLLNPRSPWRRVLEHVHAPRIVVRETIAYAGWISRSLQPEYLRSHALRRSALAATIRAEAGAGPLFPALVRTEVNAALQAQVPRFIMLPGGNRLATSSGRPLVSKFANESPAAGVLSALERLSTSHLDAVLLPALLAAGLTSASAAGPGRD